MLVPMQQKRSVKVFFTPLWNVLENWILLPALLRKKNFIGEWKEAATGSSLKECILKNFTKFTGKHVCQSLFFTRDSGAGVFLLILGNF